ncbi:MAG: PHP domain-containing protein [Fretibacterium sp.]|nr:PHP domain-containing protein [Fretibacterium sp.]
MIRINLHMHSTCSDGDCSPLELVRLLSLHKVSVASLTDHDTIEGVPVFLAACHSRGIRGVSGCEFSSRYHEDELHILGYRFDPETPALREALARYQASRTLRNAAICEKLSALGISVTLKEAEARAGGKVVGRPHIARVLQDKGYVPTLHEAFMRYLKTGAAAFVPRDLPQAGDVIRLIRETGGLPVWAHPLKSLSEPDSFPAVLDFLKESGLWGVECWFHGSSSAQTFLCLNEAGRRGLYATAGTDFHGSRHGAGIAGHVVEDDLLPWARFCGGR